MFIFITCLFLLTPPHRHRPAHTNTQKSWIRTAYNNSRSKQPLVGRSCRERGTRNTGTANEAYSFPETSNESFFFHRLLRCPRFSRGSRKQHRHNHFFFFFPLPFWYTTNTDSTQTPTHPKQTEYLIICFFFFFVVLQRTLSPSSPGDLWREREIRSRFHEINHSSFELKTPFNSIKNHF